MREPLHGYLGLGSNLGNRLLNLQEALNKLDATKQMEIERVSPVYESPAHGYESPNDYLNAVAEIQWDGTPLMLLKHCYKIEAAGGRHHRPRDEQTEFADRTIDLDILWLDEVEMVDGRLTLPHPRAARRAFVLIPWIDLDPDVTLDGYSLEDCLSALPRSEVEGVRRVPGMLTLDT